MDATNLEKRISDLFESWAKEKVETLTPLAPSGSKRIYYRIRGKTKVAIGSYNDLLVENKAFVYFSKHFKSKGLPVPEIYKEDLEHNVYLQEDLGLTTLYSFLLNKEERFPVHLKEMYKKVVEQLADIQILGHEDLDYTYCFPSKQFDKQSILWDLQSFKYYFLRFHDIAFDDIKLEKDFATLAAYLLGADSNFFMFRDFQSRNIMIKDGQPVFIDYQGGRKGALQYDLASLLFQAKADIPTEDRIALLEHYMEAASKRIPLDKKQFVKYFYAFVLIRCLQVFGTYGYRGIFERKRHFIESIPYAIKNLKWLRDHCELEFETKELFKVFDKIIDLDQYSLDEKNNEESLLTVDIKSFSYKKGIPKDKSGHGGGFVFDCRFLHNPGRYDPYKELTGRDESVINFLKQHSKMQDFLNDVFQIVDKSVDKYIERNFTNLSFHFGCTGGRHRSVYAADTLANYIKKKFGVKVRLQHRERGWAAEDL